MKKIHFGWFHVWLAGFIVIAMLSACNDDGGDKKSPEDDQSSAQPQSSTNTVSKPDVAAKTNASGPIVIAMGDSITAGTALPGAAPYPARVAKIKGVSVANKGVGGEGSCRGSKRASSVASAKAKVALILYGTNDVLGRRNFGESEQCLRAIIQAFKAAGSRVIIGTIPPMNGPMAELNPLVNEFNGVIRAVAASEGVKLVDINGEFGNGDGLLLGDGFHPNETGTQVIAFAFAGAF